MSETTMPADGRRISLPAVLVAWTVVLVAGFAVVLLLGRPLPSADEELAAAMNPSPPVSEAAAVESAETIVRLQHPDLATGERTVERRTDFGQERWVIVYSRESDLTGVRISIGVDSGRVSVATFP